ncbi:MAG: hypothetical protein ABIR96_11105, partial [Bdellovibrionota bacterium]
MTGASRKFKNLFIYPKFLLRTGLFYIFIATNTVLIGKLAIELIDSPMTAYICCFLLLMIVGLSGAWYAHRVTGPMIGIKRTCKLIAAGRHDLRVK